MVPSICFVREVYIWRIQLSAETFLLEAEARGKEAQRLKALVLILFRLFLVLILKEKYCLCPMCTC